MCRYSSVETIKCFYFNRKCIFHASCSFDMSVLWRYIEQAVYGLTRKIFWWRDIYFSGMMWIENSKVRMFPYRVEIPNSRVCVRGSPEALLFIQYIRLYFQRDLRRKSSELRAIFRIINSFGICKSIAFVFNSTIYGTGTKWKQKQCNHTSNERLSSPESPTELFVSICLSDLLSVANFRITIPSSISFRLVRWKTAQCSGHGILDGKISRKVNCDLRANTFFCPLIENMERLSTCDNYS